MENRIDFEVMGIAQVLNRNRLRVPPNQREYSWLPDVQVRDLLQDISNAIRTGQPYFLGTIVLTKGVDDFFEVADGQQRLATTMMILACIRDWFDKKGDNNRVQGIESEFLFKIDFKTGERVPRLSMNLDDNEFFANVIINRAKDRASVSPTRRSHRLISLAINEIREFISNMERQLGESNSAEGLKDMHDYLNSKASVVQLCVSDAANAFIMFETLNDRGLKTSQADLVKNYLFGKADERLAEAQNHWSSMRGAVESVGDDDLIMEFLRLACCVISGHTRERDVMNRVENQARNKTEALSFLSFLDTLSKDYAAILNPDHPKWNEYDPQIRKSIQTLNLLGVKQIRPLLLATARFLNNSNATQSFRRMVAWSVRFMIIGARGGRLDEGYAKLANKIYKQEIKDVQGLKQDANSLVVGDAEFKESFAVARVSTAKLARYYLRSLETTARNEREPEFVPNEDIVINLEHIMPSELTNWPNTTTQDIESHFARIGNMVLLQAARNNNLGSLGFDEKKEVYKESTFLLTSQVSTQDSWTPQTIEDRQRVLADLAVKTWAL